LTLDDIRQALDDQGFEVLETLDGDHAICNPAGTMVALQPGGRDQLLDTVFVALVKAGFIWPWP